MVYNVTKGYKMPKQKISIYVDDQVIVDLDKQAEKENRSRNNMWEQIAKNYINEMSIKKSQTSNSSH